MKIKIPISQSTANRNGENKNEDGIGSFRPHGGATKQEKRE
jgi:hypothetical protein